MTSASVTAVFRVMVFGPTARNVVFLMRRRANLLVGPVIIETKLHSKLDHHHQWLEEHLHFNEQFEHTGGIDLYMPITLKAN
jgi:hypothetical protein